MQCAACDAPGATKRCSACRTAYYCDSTCQNEHWIEHKRTCMLVLSAPAQPTVEERRTAFIAGLAAMKPQKVCNIWAFMPRGRVLINGRDLGAVAGDVAYAHPFDAFEFGPAVRLRDWVFVMERMTPEWRAKLGLAPGERTWYVCAFHDKLHYNFGPIEDAPKLPPVLLDFVIPRFSAIFYPEAFVGCVPDPRGFVRVEWTTAPPLPPEALQN